MARAKTSAAGNTTVIVSAEAPRVSAEAPREFWPMARPSGLFYVRHVGQELYSSDAQAYWELVRNGLTSGMDHDAREWETARAATVDIWFETGHPLCPTGTICLIKDNGRGFTPEDIARYCDPGGNKGARYGGASHKQIGRFAGYKLNNKAGPENPDEGFYVLTRTTPTGPITVAHIFPRLHDQGKTAETWKIQDTDPLLGSRFNGIRGSFSIIGIPNVIADITELRRDLAPYLPRKINQALHISIQGLPLEPLPLPKKMLPLPEDGGEIHADLKDGRRILEEGGLWLCDARSGLPVAHLPHVSGVPDPISRLDLTGCVYWPNLLGNQDTSRRGLKTGYLRSKDGKKLLEILGLARVADWCNLILGNRNVLNGDVGDIVTRFGNLALTVFGAPKSTGGGEAISPKPPTRPPSHHPGPTHPDSSGESGGRDSESGASKPLRRSNTMVIGGKEYALISLPIPDGHRFAEVHPGRKIIQLNPEFKPWKLLPQTVRAHLAFENILRAAANDQFGGERERARAHAEWWLRLLTAERTTPKTT